MLIKNTNGQAIGDIINDIIKNKSENLESFGKYHPYYDFGETSLGTLGKNNIKKIERIPKATPSKANDGSAGSHFFRRKISSITANEDSKRYALKDTSQIIFNILNSIQDNKVENAEYALTNFTENIGKLETLGYKKEQVLDARIGILTSHMTRVEVADLIDNIFTASENYPKFKPILESTLRVFSNEIVRTIAPEFVSLMAISANINKDNPEKSEFIEKLNQLKNDFFGKHHTIVEEEAEQPGSLTPRINGHIYAQLIKIVLSNKQFQEKIFEQIQKEAYGNGKTKKAKPVHYTLEKFLTLLHIALKEPVKQTLYHMASILDFEELIQIENFNFIRTQGLSKEKSSPAFSSEIKLQQSVFIIQDEKSEIDPCATVAADENNSTEETESNESFATVIDNEEYFFELENHGKLNNHYPGLKFSDNKENFLQKEFSYLLNENNFTPSDLAEIHKEITKSIIKKIIKPIEPIPATVSIDTPIAAEEEFYDVVMENAFSASENHATLISEKYLDEDFQKFIKTFEKIIIHKTKEKRKFNNYADLLSLKLYNINSHLYFTNTLTELASNNDIILQNIHTELQNSFGKIAASDILTISYAAEFIWTQVINKKSMEELEKIHHVWKAIRKVYPDFRDIIGFFAANSDDDLESAEVYERMKSANISLEAICNIFDTIDENQIDAIQENTTSKYLSDCDKIKKNNYKELASKIQTIKYKQPIEVLRSRHQFTAPRHTVNQIIIYFERNFNIDLKKLGPKRGDCWQFSTGSFDDDFEDLTVDDLHDLCFSYILNKISNYSVSDPLNDPLIKPLRYNKEELIKHSLEQLCEYSIDELFGHNIIALCAPGEPDADWEKLYNQVEMFKNFTNDA